MKKTTLVGVMFWLASGGMACLVASSLHTGNIEAALGCAVAVVWMFAYRSVEKQLETAWSGWLKALEERADAEERCIEMKFKLLRYEREKQWEA